MPAVDGSGHVAETRVNVQASNAAPGETGTHRRPSVLEATKAVDADAARFEAEQRAICMSLIFRRRKRNGGLANVADVTDYQDMVSIAERGGV